MKKETKLHLRRALWSYLRAAAAAVAAMLLAGMDDPTVITVSALLGGLLGPLIKALDPNDDSYGIGASISNALKSEIGEEPVAEDTQVKE